jgi:hypothetical protein
MSARTVGAMAGLALAALGVMGSSGGCSDDADDGPRARGRRRVATQRRSTGPRRTIAPRRVPSNGVTDLGVVGRSDPGVEAMRYQWSVGRGPGETFRLGFGLPAAERASMQQRSRALWDAWRCSLNGFISWCRNVPPGCAGDLDSCFLRRLSAISQPSLRPVEQRFARLQREAGLDAMAISRVIVAFVQEINYQVPQDPFGIVLPPIEVADNRGDCDSKALLASLLLGAVGVRSVVFSSRSRAHAILGIAVPTAGRYMDHGGVRWALAEVTAKDTPIGYMAPEMQSARDWRGVFRTWGAGERR